MQDFISWVESKQYDADLYTPWGTPHHDPPIELYEKRRRERRVNRILNFIKMLDDEEFNMLLSKLNIIRQEKKSAI